MVISVWNGGGRCPLRDMTDGGLAQRVVPYFIVGVGGGRGPSALLQGLVGFAGRDKGRRRVCEKERWPRSRRPFIPHFPPFYGPRHLQCVLSRRHCNKHPPNPFGCQPRVRYLRVEGKEERQGLGQGETTGIFFTRAVGTFCARFFDCNQEQFNQPNPSPFKVNLTVKNVNY